MGGPLSSRPVYLVYLPYRPAARSGAFFGAPPADGAVDAPNLPRRRFFSTFGGGCTHRRCSFRQCRRRQPCHRACIGVVLWARRALPRELLSADCHVPWPGLARSGRGVPRRGRQFLCSLPPAPMDSRQLHRAPTRDGCAVFGFVEAVGPVAVAVVCAAAVPRKVSSAAICRPSALGGLSWMVLWWRVQGSSPTGRTRVEHAHHSRFSTLLQYLFSPPTTQGQVEVLSGSPALFFCLIANSEGIKRQLTPSNSEVTKRQLTSA